jgi:S1-C subfamily serine protease
MAIAATPWPIVPTCDELECYRTQGEKNTEIAVLSVGAAVLAASSVYGFYSSARCVPPVQEPVRFGGDLVRKDAPAPQPATEPLPPAPQRVARAVARPEPRLLGTGTCFAVGPNVVATSYHVVKDAETLVVKRAGGSATGARLTRFSSTTDLALLQIEEPMPVYLRLEGSAEAALGDRVFTIGFPAPLQLGWEPKFTEGVISSLSVGGEDSLMQVSVPVQPGNSGGPLVSESGTVLGVVSARAKDGVFLRATGSLPANVAYATKASYLQPLLQSRTLPEAQQPKARADIIKAVSEAVCLVGKFGVPEGE